MSCKGKPKQSLPHSYYIKYAPVPKTKCARWWAMWCCIMTRTFRSIRLGYISATMMTDMPVSRMLLIQTKLLRTNGSLGRFVANENNIAELYCMANMFLCLLTWMSNAICYSALANIKLMANRVYFYVPIWWHSLKLEQNKDFWKTRSDRCNTK